MRPLYDLQPAQPRNARLWDGTAGTGAITVPSEIRNAATLDDARRLAGMNPHLPHREDVRAAFVAGREDRERNEAPTVAQKELEMPRSSKEATTARRAALIAALPGTPASLREALPAYASFEASTLNYDLRMVGATRGEDGAYSIAAEKPKKARAAAVTSRPIEPSAAPVRPSLARAAREAIREANESDAPVYLDPAFAKALHGMLVEAGL